jgi:hypothetical protein
MLDDCFIQSSQQKTRLTHINSSERDSETLALFPLRSEAVMCDCCEQLSHDWKILFPGAAGESLAHGYD